VLCNRVIKTEWFAYTMCVTHDYYINLSTETNCRLRHMILSTNYIYQLRQKTQSKQLTKQIQISLELIAPYCVTCSIASVVRIKALICQVNVGNCTKQKRYTALFSRPVRRTHLQRKNHIRVNQVTVFILPTSLQGLCFRYIHVCLRVFVCVWLCVEYLKKL